MKYLSKIQQKLKEFTFDKDGAVTVDFVVLTAAIVMFGAIAITILAPKVSALMGSVTVAPGVVS